MPADLACGGTGADHDRGGPTIEGKDSTMGAGDKIKNAAEDAAGKAKEALGKLTDDEKTEAEGKTDQGKANVKKAGENIKDAFGG